METSNDIVYESTDTYDSVEDLICDLGAEINILSDKYPDENLEPLTLKITHLINHFDFMKAKQAQTFDNLSDSLFENKEL